MGASITNGGDLEVEGSSFEEAMDKMIDDEQIKGFTFHESAEREWEDERQGVVYFKSKGEEPEDVDYTNGSEWRFYLRPGISAPEHDYSGTPCPM